MQIQGLCDRTRFGLAHGSPCGPAPGWYSPTWKGPPLPLPQAPTLLATHDTAAESPVRNRTFRTRELIRKLAGSRKVELTLGEKALTCSARRRYGSEMEARAAVFWDLRPWDPLPYIYVIK